jgi:acetyl esterase
MIYSKVLDSEIFNFVNKCESFYPNDGEVHSKEVQRESYNRLCNFFKVENPIQISTYDFKLSGTKLRKYTPKSYSDRIVFYIHGGGWVVGGLDSHDDICAELSLITNSTVYGIDYRLAPEHRHPAALEDCIKAVKYIYETEEKKIILIGDSAGGNLVAALSDCSEVQKNHLLAQILIYPGLGNLKNNGSRFEHAQAPLLSVKDMDYYHSNYFKNENYLSDKGARPLISNTLSELPKTYIFVAQFDPLFDDGYEYYKKINEQGGHAEFNEGKGLIHGHLRARHCSVKAMAEFQKIINIIANL